MTSGKETLCSSCHGEMGPDINGCIMCYGCGPAERLPPERRAHAGGSTRGVSAPAPDGDAKPMREPVVGARTARG